MLLQKNRGQVFQHPTPNSNQPRKGGPMVSSSIAGAGLTATPQNQAGNPPAVLLTGVDTLELTAGGAGAPSSWLLEQQEVWNDYQITYDYGNPYCCIELDNKWWELYPYGSNPYKYLLHNKEVGFIKIWNMSKWSSGVQGKQQVHLKLFSKYLHQYTTKTLYDEVVRIVSYFFEDVNEIQIQISRIDLHTDISNGANMLSMEELRNSISRSKVRDYFMETDTLVLTQQEEDLLFGDQSYNKVPQKLIPMDLLDKLSAMYYNQKSVGCDRVITKRNVETATFGKFNSSVWGKIYNKTAEVKNKNDNDTPLMWINNGWNKKDTVVRVEFSMRREFLKQLDKGLFVSLDHFLKNIANVWDYLTNKWLRLVEEVKENNTTWSKITPFWYVVSTSFKEVCNVIIRKKVYKAKVNKLWSQGIGCLKQMISIGMVSNNDTMFLKATIQAVENTLSSSLSSGDYYLRRQHLGVA